MSTIVFSVFLGLISSLFGSVSNTAAKFVMRFTNTKDYIVVNFAIIFILLTPFSFWFFDLEQSVVGISLVVLASIIDGIANYLYFKAFEIGSAVTASTILSLSPLFTLLLFPLVGDEGGEGFTLFKILGIVIIVIGIVILNNSEKNKGVEIKSWKVIGIPLLASLIFGGNVYLIKYLFVENITNPYSYYYIRALVIVVLLAPIIRPRIAWVNIRTLLIAGGRSVMVITQWLFLLTALEAGNPAVVKSVSDTSPLFVIIWARLFLNEDITAVKIFGAVTIVLGLVVLLF